MSEAVATAWAWHTPLGTGTEALDRLNNGESPDIKRIVGEPPRHPESRYLHRAALFAWDAACTLVPAGPPDPRLGVFTGLGGLRALWDDLGVAMMRQNAEATDLWAHGLGKVHPYWMLRHLSNNLHALLAIRLGAAGEGTTVAGPTGGAGALAAAIRALAVGTIDRALVVGVDTLLQPEIQLEGEVHGRWVHGAPGEAAVALLLSRGGRGPRVWVEGGAGSPLPAREVRRKPGPNGVLPGTITHAMGDLGAATSLAQIVALLATGGVGESGGPPGLWARVHVHTEEAG